jgi:phosphoglycolate phosphatase
LTSTALWQLLTKLLYIALPKLLKIFNIIPPAADTIIGTIGINLPNTFKILHPAIEESAIPEWVETYRSYYRTEGEKQVDLFPGTKQILQLVSKSGLSLGVFSNKQVSFVNLLLKRLKSTVFLI